MSVCLSRTSGLTREKRDLERLNLTQRWPTSHVTRTPLSRSKGQRQGHQTAVLSAALTRKAAAAVSVGTYSTWESTATFRLLGDARGAWAPTGERGGGILCRHAHGLLKCNLKIFKHGFTMLRSQILHKVNLHRGSILESYPPPAGGEEPHFPCRLFTLGVAVLQVAALP